MGRKRGAKNQIAASTSEEIHHIETIILNPEEGAAGDDVGPPHEANNEACLINTIPTRSRFHCYLFIFSSLV